MTISDIEARSNLPRASVRFYENEGFLSPSRGENGYRDYSYDDLALLKKIRLLRQLGVPLTEIKTLHAGQTDLAAVIDKRIEEIGGEQRSLADQKTVCGEIRADGATYSGLDAEKYLARLQSLPYTNDSFLHSDKLEPPKADYPWRRYFARTLDLSIYMLLWQAAAYLGFNWKITGLWLLNLIVEAIIMLLIEPVLLTLFGTTPGKAVFGIRVTNIDGGKLTLYQGYARIWSVFTRGTGYGIPIYSLVRCYKSYKICKERGEMEWDEELCYTVKDTNPLRPVAFVLCSLLIAAAMFCLPFAADMPKYRGDLTTRQFADNMNRYLRYNGLKDELGTVGTLPDDSFSAVSPLLGPLPPVFRLIETDGAVTEITMEIQNADFFSLDSMQQWIQACVNSYIGAQKGMNFFGFHFGGINGNISSGYGYNSYSFTEAGVDVIYNIEIDRHPMSDFGYLLDHIMEKPVISARFVMRKI